MGGEWKASMRTRGGLAGDPGNKERINMLYMHVCVCVRAGWARVGKRARTVQNKTKPPKKQQVHWRKEKKNILTPTCNPSRDPW